MIVSPALPSANRMAAEIAEQPQALRATLAELLPQRANIAEHAAGRRHLLFIGRGSSHHAALYGRYLAQTQTPLSAALAAPSLATHYHAKPDLSDTVVISLSQSGQTEEIVSAQSWASDRGAVTFAIANQPDSPLVRDADLPLVTRAGPELAVPATKSYLAQLAAVAVIISALSPHGDRLTAALGNVADEVRTMLQSDITAAVATLAKGDGTFVVGRGIALTTALEAALKLEETCLRPVRAVSYADLRHGPMAFVGDGFTAMVFSAHDGPLVAGMTDIVLQLRELGAQVVGIGGNADFGKACDVALPGPRLPESLAPLGLIVPAQLIVERLAKELGLNPDNPRGLAKITQTERPVTAS